VSSGPHHVASMGGHLDNGNRRTDGRCGQC
jgi:hypothetical protein